MILIHQFLILILGIFFLIFFKILKCNKFIFLFFKKKFQNKIYIKFPYIYKNSLIYIPLLSLIDGRGIGRFSKNVFYRTYIFKNQVKLFYPSKSISLYPSVHHVSPNFNISSSLIFILDIIPLQYPEKYDSLVLDDWNKKFSKIIISAKYLYTISKTSKFNVESFFQRADVSIIYPGINHLSTQYQNGSHFSSPASDYFVFLGSTSANKNIESILKEINYIDNKISIIVIGDSSSIANNFTNSRIHFMGFVSEKKKEFLLENSMFMVCPSISEGFGFAQFEAAKYKKPSIMSNIDIYKELWSNRGFFCDHDQPDQWVNKINYLATNKEKLREMGLKAHLNYKKFTWEKTISSIDKEIDKII
jgi:hypothetical protein